jgi:Fic-DOC domain mobile mystery protein B
MAIWKPISGETPIADISGLIPRGIRTRTELNLAEAENIRGATVRYLAIRPTQRQAPFTLPWLYRLHGQMFGRVWKWAGTRRTTELNLGVAAHEIDVELHKMLDDLACWHKSGMESNERAARIHHRAVSVHPFLNGNGRWSRTLANVWLRRQGKPLTLWPEQAVGDASVIRQEYLAAIRAADMGSLELLIALHRKYVQSA